MGNPDRDQAFNDQLPGEARPDMRPEVAAGENPSDTDRGDIPSGEGEEDANSTQSIEDGKQPDRVHDPGPGSRQAIATTESQESNVRASGSSEAWNKFRRNS